MLHVLNGDSLAKSFREAGIEGDALPWGDMLMEGPARNGLRTGEDWVHRAETLHARFGIPVEEYLGTISHLHTRLQEARKHEEVVLWFEEDLFCQVHVAYLLRLLAGLDLAETRITLVLTDEALGGGTPPGKLRTLFERRQPATPGRRGIALRFWDAYTRADPIALASLLRDDFQPWPLLLRGVEAHLARFPDARTGLGRPERLLLEGLRDGPRGFAELFTHLRSFPEGAAYGMGDVQVAALLREMAAGGNALCLFAEGAPAPGDPLIHAPFGQWRLELTPMGRAVLDGTQNAVAQRGIDRWLGGVHVQGRGPVWRYDSAGRTVALV